MKEDEESDSESDLDLCEISFDQIECENCSLKHFFCHNEEYGEHYYANLRCKNRLCPKCLIASSPETCCYEFRLYFFLFYNIFQAILELMQNILGNE